MNLDGKHNIQATISRKMRVYLAEIIQRRLSNFNGGKGKNYFK